LASTSNTAYTVSKAGIAARSGSVPVNLLFDISLSISTAQHTNHMINQAY
jgi:hypothetical protein